ncbi:hypothetical protein [Amycolatopsis kentuckyensis]|uniref:hypothetical protein n=1 Tax=Amycolatopsis kentuckyensis TaxID=218823 RepID=UPI003562988B
MNLPEIAALPIELADRADWTNEYGSYQGVHVGDILIVATVAPFGNEEPLLTICLPDEGPVSFTVDLDDMKDTLRLVAAALVLAAEPVYALPEIDELPEGLAINVAWGIAEGVLLARVGETVIACNPGDDACTPKVLVVESPSTGPQVFRIAGDAIVPAAQLVVSALMLAAPPGVAEGAAVRIPRACTRLAAKLVDDALDAIQPERRQLLVSE